MNSERQGIGHVGRHGCGAEIGDHGDQRVAGDQVSLPIAGGPGLRIPPEMRASDPVTVDSGVFGGERRLQRRDGGLGHAVPPSASMCVISAAAMLASTWALDGPSAVSLDSCAAAADDSAERSAAIAAFLDPGTLTAPLPASVPGLGV